MFENIDSLQLNLLYRALNTERNTINRFYALQIGVSRIDEEDDENYLLVVPEEIEGDHSASFYNQRRAILKLINEVYIEMDRRHDLSHPTV